MRARILQMVLALVSVVALCVSVLPAAAQCPSELVFSSKSVDFGPHPVGSSTTQAFTIHNPAAPSFQHSYTIGALTTSGSQQGDYAATVDNPTLGQNGTSLITVTFTPHGTGDRSASLSIPLTFTVIEARPQTVTCSVTLDGSGTSPTLCVSPPEELQFMTQQVGTTS